jgi:AcrR family transcriptional regulator
VSDDELFSATHAVMNRVGPGELTLAAIAREAGVTAAVLVQRFGSKRALLLALSERFAGSAGAMIDLVARQHRSPLAAIRNYAECVAGMASTPAAFARSLAYLQIDLTDPDFRGHLVKHARATRQGLARLLARAVEAGELSAGASPARLARAVETAISGSMLTWAFYQDGPAAQWIRTDVDAALAPYLAERAPGRRRPARPRRRAGRPPSRTP